MFKIMLCSQDGPFQQCNEKGNFDDVTFFESEEEAQALIPSINEKWNQHGVSAKVFKA